MHIPDGYLSPSTCAVLYATSGPFWYVALRRLRRQLHTRFVPLTALFAALSFVVMMFNVPLPGGTTGHATGTALAAIVLGPWAAMISVSIALVIQALFFGDGGITAIGANCFNIAITGSLVAYGVYRLIGPRHKVIAAGLAGYAAINVSALLTALEFGVQPLWFKDASGAPLYAPYPLSIAVPAMMIGHLTIAGLAEAVLTGGVVAWLQRSDPALLEKTSGQGAGTRSLWAMLALLLILAPLGTLAVGSAWGEWSAEDLRNPETRQRIAKTSRNTALPAEVPKGLERLSTVWTAPIPDYAPPMLRSPAFGYLMSGMVGAGIVILVSLMVAWSAGRLRNGA